MFTYVKRSYCVFMTATDPGKCDIGVDTESSLIIVRVKLETEQGKQGAFETCGMPRTVWNTSVPGL